MKKEGARVLAAGSFRNLDVGDVRFLHEARRYGAVSALILPVDTGIGGDARGGGHPLEERKYFVESIRYVESLVSSPAKGITDIDLVLLRDTGKIAAEASGLLEVCRDGSVECRILPEADLSGFPPHDLSIPSAGRGRKRVVVTGCFDWLHTGHIRFFEEVSEYGELHVVVGSDRNVELLKGKEHPLYPEEQRRYMTEAVRFVERAYVSSGTGWMDAEPEIRSIRPDIYAVNEDGDKPEKRSFCEEHGIEYLVLKRTPKSGMPRRSSTDLRGF
ncbi:MAG: adenylyltransferase/cytidyltransferase family protein [Spirochaetia bacterium]